MPFKKQNVGYLFAFLAYFCWGFFPIYWKLLKHVPVGQILAHRVLWAFVFYTLISTIKNKKISLFKPKSKKLIIALVFASTMLMANWLIYIYAVNSNQIVESSLGYFITPIFNILFGVFLLKEKLSRYQTVSALMAAFGVAIVAYDQGHIPLIALSLALTFSIYGLVKKMNPLPSLQSNQFESLLFCIPALVFLFLDKNSWATPDNLVSTSLILVGSGVATGLPLLFFSEAAQRIPYYMMGFFQFLAPSLQFLCGVLIFNEIVSPTKMLGFAFIWSATFVLIFVGYLKSRKK